MNSEAASKKRRGRPPAFDPESTALMEGIILRGLTRRQVRNKQYAYRAINVLNIGPNGGHNSRARFAWLVDFPAADAGKRGAAKWAVLTEIGRMRHESDVVALAELVCDRAARYPYVSIKSMAAFARNMRLSAYDRKRKPAERWDLVGRLAAALDQFCSERPDCTDQQILDALNDLYCIVQDRGEVK